MDNVKGILFILLIVGCLFWMHPALGILGCVFFAIGAFN